VLYPFSGTVNTGDKLPPFHKIEATCSYLSFLKTKIKTMLKTKYLMRASDISSNDLSVVISPRSRMTYCHLNTENFLKHPEYMGQFIECWVQEFQPHHSRTNNPILLSNLILHFYLFNCLQNSYFAKFIVTQRRVIDHPVYQKSIFDRLALEVHTDFSSRVKGSTNSVEDLQALCAHLTFIAESSDHTAFSQLFNFSLFGFVTEKRDIIAGFSNFQSLVKDLQSGTLDDVLGNLLTLNNRVVKNLDNITSRTSSFTVVSEIYENFSSVQLGLYKFRNIDNDTYAIQEKG
jgi:hypothetical protein